MATTKARRPLAARTVTEIDKLASKFSSVKITSDTRAKPRAQTRGQRDVVHASTDTMAGHVEERSEEASERARSAAMRNVNNVLQALSAAAADPTKVNTARGALATSAAAGRAALNLLRELAPAQGSLDTERAALSMAGKLLALEINDRARDVLDDVRRHLPTHYATEKDVSLHDKPLPSPLSLLHLPLPLAGSSCDVPIQTCASTYFTHAFSVISRALATNPNLCGVLSDSLYLRKQPTLNHWISSYLSELPSKVVDALLKRVYVALSSGVGSSTAAPVHILRVRFYALRVLLMSAELDVTPFWEQCLKYAAAYARNPEVRESEKAKITVLLECFAPLEGGTGGKREGKGWIAFCEYWMALAKRAKDTATVDRIAAHIEKMASTSNDLPSLVTRTCAALTHLTTTLEEEGGQAESKAHRIAEESKSCSVCLRDLRAALGAEARMEGKLRRAIEKCRKECIKGLGFHPDGSRAKESIEEVCQAVNGLLDRFGDADSTAALLDGLFQLATAGLNPSNAGSCDRSFSYLVDAERKIQQVSSFDFVDGKTHANYIRCLAGAFANAAGLLYKAERHSFATRFLTKACLLSASATAAYNKAHAANPEDDSKGKAREERGEKDVQAWKTHRMQAFRRWELLGVCYSKTGDRNMAFDAFVQAVLNFPFTDEKSLSSPEVMRFKTLPETSRAVFNSAERLTYLGAAELQLEASSISLLPRLHSLGLSGPVAGLLLMSQIQSLLQNGGRSKPKMHTVASALLQDLISVYPAEQYPVRRAGVLVLLLEHHYYCHDEGESYSSSNAEILVEQIESLVSSAVNLRDDGEFGPLCKYYHVTALLWQSLHIHRDGGNVLLILKKIRKALEIITGIVNPPTKQAMGKARKDGKTTGIAAKAGIGKERTRQTRPTPPTLITKSRSAKIAPVSKTPATPKPDEVTRVVHNATIFNGLEASEISSLVGLMQMVSELLGLMGQIDVRMKVLEKARHLLCMSNATTSDEYLIVSANLSHDLLKLGLISKSKDLIGPIVGNMLSATSTVSSSSSAVLLLLRFSETLAESGDIPQSLAMYERAFRLAQDLEDGDKEKTLPTAARIRARVIALERTAMAAGVYAAIQESKNEVTASLKALLQALRLLNRAADALSRLAPVKKPDASVDASDPFSMAGVQEALPAVNGTINGGSPKNDVTTDIDKRSHLDGLEWRVAKALFETMLSLSHAYAFRGSAREAEYFTQQAEDLARILNMRALVSRALLSKCEIFLFLGRTEDARKSLEEAEDTLEQDQGLVLEKANLHRLKGDYLLRNAREEEAHDEYQNANNDLELAKRNTAWTQNLSNVGSSDGTEEMFLPVLQAMILKQQVWLLRDELGEEYTSHLERLLALPQSPSVEVHVNSLLGRLALYDIHERFRSDLSLSSLAESIIALPTGMTLKEETNPSPSQDILEALEQADELFISDLSKLAERDSVVNVRAAAIAAALTSTYRASLLQASEYGPTLVSHLLDMASSITLRRELMETISFKSIDPRTQDDLEWPTISLSPRKFNRKELNRQRKGLFSSPTESDEDDCLDDTRLKQYWEYVLRKHRTQAFIPIEDCEAEISRLPKSWVVISVSLTDDKNSLLISRQQPNHEPVIFCVPLKGRRESEEEHFTFEDAINELKGIIKCSDEGTRRASQIQTSDKEAKAEWWAERKQLDLRMKELLDNIEFCWLGAFKTIFSQPMQIPPDVVSNLQARFDKVFRGILGSHEKRVQKTKLSLEESVIELFSDLPPTCKDEELEDLIYYVLDLYHFRGLPVALAEIDIDHVTVDLRTTLEEHHARTRELVVPEPEAHTFLILDKNVQMIPWESLPIMRGHSASRVPSIAFVTDRLALARLQNGLTFDQEYPLRRDLEKADCPPVDTAKGYYVLNPGGDLKGTEGRFKDWANGLQKIGWDGVVGRPPSEQQFLDALIRKDLVVYFGHGGAEQYARSHKIRHLPRCAATMLWGCSSGALKDMGDFDCTGTPNNYMLAGCPALVANLWDVTDRDIDKFAFAVFDKLHLEPAQIRKSHNSKQRSAEARASLTTAVAKSRDACKLKYLTGSAVVVYGIPLYL